MPPVALALPGRRRRVHPGGPAAREALRRWLASPDATRAAADALLADPDVAALAQGGPYPYQRELVGLLKALGPPPEPEPEPEPPPDPGPRPGTHAWAMARPASGRLRAG